MADALASGASVLRDVGVQVPLRPPRGVLRTPGAKVTNQKWFVTFVFGERCSQAVASCRAGDVGVQIPFGSRCDYISSSAQQECNSVPERHKRCQQVITEGGSDDRRRLDRGVHAALDARLLLCLELGSGDPGVR